MIWIVVLMVIGRFLWRICFFGSAVRVTADLRERMFDHSRRLSQQYYQVNKVGNLSLIHISARPRSSQAPVSPATKPRATLSQSSSRSTPETLMP